MVAFYSQGDQDIYNSGIKFRPQQKYLLLEIKSKPCDLANGFPTAIIFFLLDVYLI